MKRTGTAVVILAATCAFGQKAIPQDFGEKLMRPYIYEKLDTFSTRHQGVKLTLTRYLAKGIRYEEAYKVLGDPLRKAGWKQLGGLDVAIDSRACRWTAPSGRFYQIEEFAASRGIEFLSATPVRIRK